MIMEKEICKSRKNNICMEVHVEQYDKGRPSLPQLFAESFVFREFMSYDV